MMHDAGVHIARSDFLECEIGPIVAASGSSKVHVNLTTNSEVSRTFWSCHTNRVLGILSRLRETFPLKSRLMEAFYERRRPHRRPRKRYKNVTSYLIDDGSLQIVYENRNGDRISEMSVFDVFRQLDVGR
jgi:hypothetical protein